jgi:hypothetical protein
MAEARLTISMATSGARRRKLSPFGADVVAAFVAALAILLIYAVAGLPSLWDAEGDNDSLLRLVEVRDLVAGQGWFDLHQYRMGMPGGFEMHWSRLVDAPIAAIILVVSTLTGSMAAGETAALILWPVLLLAAALFLILRAVRTIGGEEAMLPAIVLGAAALYFGGQFAPAAIDHHNVQLVLALAMIAALLRAGERNHGGALAGACAALMLAVGMETMPYVAAAGAWVAITFLLDGQAGRRTAIGFGLSFAAVSAIVFFGTVSPRAWSTVRCDALSVAQLGIAAISGAGLAAIAGIPLVHGRRPARVAALLVLGIAVGAVAVFFFPQCLADPYAGLDPRLKMHWMDAISEAQPLWSMIGSDPGKAIKYYASPLLGLVVVGLGLWRGGARRGLVLVGVFLLTAILVSVWQVRGAMFSIPFAAVPLAAWVGAWRRRAADKGKPADTLRMAAAWLLSLNVTWTLAVALGSLVPPLFRADAAPQAGEQRKCRAAEDYEALASLPAGGVLAVANHGAPILRYTPHRVLAGLYHRNIEANLLTLSAFTGPAAGAQALVREQGLAYVVICPGDDETRMLAEQAPAGFVTLMLEGNAPHWLEPIAGSTEEPLRIYRVLTGR